MSKEEIKDEESPYYRFDASNGCTVISLFGNLENGFVPDFERKLALHRKSHPGNILVNCEALEDLSLHWLRTLLALTKKLKDEGQKAVLFGVKYNIIQYMGELGVEQAFKVRPNLELATKEIKGETKYRLDVNFINPFLKGAMHVLKIQAYTDAKAGAIRSKASNEKIPSDITGIIALVSDSFSGSVVISFPAETFLKIVSRMVGEECKEMNPDIDDGAAEILNMIFGQAKIELNELGYGIKTAIPTVVHGDEYSALTKSSGPQIVVPFETDVGRFHVEICLAA